MAWSGRGLLLGLLSMVLLLSATPAKANFASLSNVDGGTSFLSFSFENVGGEPHLWLRYSWRDRNSGDRNYQPRFKYWLYGDCFPTEINLNDTPDRRHLEIEVKFALPASYCIEADDAGPSTEYKLIVPFLSEDVQFASDRLKERVVEFGFRHRYLRAE